MRKNSKNLQIEGLRGAGALLVLFYHVFCRYQQIFLESSIWWIAPWGTIGVAFFLMISCFYLVDFTQNTESFSLYKFLLNRIKRLWPCYALSITITAIAVHLFYLPERMSTWLDYLVNLTMVNGFIGVPYVDGAHWYLSTLLAILFVMGIAKKLGIEKNPYFYLGWMGIRFTLRYISIPYKNGIAAVLGGSYVGYVCITIAAKAILTALQQKTQKPLEMIQWGIVFVCGIGLVGIQLGIVKMILVLACLFIFLLCVLEKLPFMSNPFLLFMGSVSYPLYLIHQNIAFEVEYYLTLWTGEYHYLYGIAAIAVVSVFTALLYWVDGAIQKKLSSIT